MLLILALVVTLFSSSCSPIPVVAKSPPKKVSEKTGLPFGTVITLGGKKMIVISQENEEVRLKPFVIASVVDVKAEAPKGEVKPEWESKTVITEGVKNVQECLNPSGCPQDTKTGECLEGCSEVQKVRVEMTETIIDPEKITSALDQGFRATTDFSEISHVNAILICVPTPLAEGNKPDLSYIRSTLESIRSYLSADQLMVLETTTYPGTTEEEIVPIVESAGFTVGENYFIGYSPEREDPGNPKFSTQTIPKVVSGYSKKCLELTETLYDQIIEKTVPVSSLRVAEMTKILENIHNIISPPQLNQFRLYIFLVVIIFFIKPCHTVNILPLIFYMIFH